MVLLFLACPAHAEWGTAGTGAHYDTFDTGQSKEKGSQFFVPLNVRTGPDSPFFLGVASGWVDTSYQPAGGGEKVRVKTPLDTNLTAFYTIPWEGACFRLGVSANLPTGKATLSARERAAEIDRNFGDLVGVTNFGRGFDANPGFSMTLPLGKLTLGVGVSHNKTGAYDPTSDVENDKLNPGDETAGKLSIGWTGDRVRFLIGGRYTAVSADKVEGREIFKEGGQAAANLRLEVPPAPVGFSLESSYQAWAKNKQAAGDGGLAAEEVASFGTDWRYRVGVQYVPVNNLTLELFANGHRVQANDYAKSSAYFDGGRNALEGGLGFDYSILAFISFNGRFSYQNVKDKADAALSNDTTYKGFKSSLNLVARY
ncbi:MAG: hypothetical protein HY039_12860 [Nitrospirae bacterium]|nr:hypothetical protein [Nitrospirota bacterium]